MNPITRRFALEADRFERYDLYEATDHASARAMSDEHALWDLHLADLSLSSSLRKATI